MLRDGKWNFIDEVSMVCLFVVGSVGGSRDFACLFSDESFTVTVRLS